MKNNNKGITLIALVITIIIMLILASVSINMAVNGGLFSYAGRAASETNKAIQDEQEMLNLEDNLTPEQIAFKMETYGYTATLYGDCNENGSVNNKDLTRLQRYLDGSRDSVTPVGKLNADVFHDGVLDNKDLIILHEYLKSGEPELPYIYEIIYGDCNEDGRVTMTDVVVLATYLNGGTMGYKGQINADVNEDGELDDKDLQILTDYIKSRGAFSLPKVN